MRAHTANPAPPVTELLGHHDRRYSNRTPILFSGTYSCVSIGQMLIADSVATNLHRAGLIHGNRSVTPGMDMALFVDLPGAEEPLCIVQSQASWVAEFQYGVALGLDVGREESFPIVFGRSHSPSNRDGGIRDHSRNKEVFS